MKTSKGKVSGKPSKIRSVSPGKSVPSEDEIREKAQEIYYERIARGEYGTAEGDWHVAEELLRDSKE